MFETIVLIIFVRQFIYINHIRKFNSLTSYQLILIVEAQRATESAGAYPITGSELSDPLEGRKVQGAKTDIQPWR